MSENKREKVKITIQCGEDTRVIECHGVALATITDDGENYACNACLTGHMSRVDLLCLKECVEENLVDRIDQNIKPEDPMAILLGIFGGK